MAYDEQQKLTKVTDSRGHQQRFTYDANNNRIQDGFYDESGVQHYQVSRSFDYLDHLATVSDINGITQYDIDNLGRLTSLTDALSGIDSYEYDALNRQVKHTDALATEINTQFDNHDNLISVSSVSNSDLDNPTELTQTHYQYDDFGRKTSQISPATGRSEYQYDESDNIIAMKDARGVKTLYQYDAVK